MLNYQAHSFVIWVVVIIHFFTHFRNPSQALAVNHLAVANVLHWGAPTTMTAGLR